MKVRDNTGQVVEARCDACRYWCRNPDYIYDISTGECRRNAPTEEGRTGFTTPDGNWCGEFKWEVEEI